MSEVIIVDRRTDRAINRTDLPKGIDLAKLHAFLRAHQVGFYSLDVFSERAGWARHPDEFRVATHDFPSRGVNTSFDKVREWLAGLEKCDIQESEAIGALLSALEERAVNAGLVRTAAVLRTAMLEIDRETAILIDAAGPREAANDVSRAMS